MSTKFISEREREREREGANISKMAQEMVVCEHNETGKEEE